MAGGSVQPPEEARHSHSADTERGAIAWVPQLIGDSAPQRPRVGSPLKKQEGRTSSGWEIAAEDDAGGPGGRGPERTGQARPLRAI